MNGIQLKANSIGTFLIASSFLCECHPFFLDSEQHCTSLLQAPYVVLLVKPLCQFFSIEMKKSLLSQRRDLLVSYLSNGRVTALMLIKQENLQLSSICPLFPSGQVRLTLG